MRKCFRKPHFRFFILSEIVIRRLTWLQWHKSSDTVCDRPYLNLNESQPTRSGIMNILPTILLVLMQSFECSKISFLEAHGDKAPIRTKGVVYTGVKNASVLKTGYASIVRVNPRIKLISSLKHDARDRDMVFVRRPIPSLREQSWRKSFVRHRFWTTVRVPQPLVKRFRYFVSYHMIHMTHMIW